MTLSSGAIAVFATHPAIPIVIHKLQAGESPTKYLRREIYEDRALFHGLRRRRPLRCVRCIAHRYIPIVAPPARALGNWWLPSFVGQKLHRQRVRCSMRRCIASRPSARPPHHSFTRLRVAAMRRLSTPAKLPPPLKLSSKFGRSEVLPAPLQENGFSVWSSFLDQKEVRLSSLFCW